MRSLGLLFAAALLCACTDGRAPESTATCTPSPDRLAELERSLVDCSSDDDCPCGAGCALGACTYECTTDAACGGERSCDAHGRCQP